MKKAALYFFSFALLSFGGSCPSAGQLPDLCTDSLCFVRIVKDSVFGSPQQISLLILNREALHKYELDLAYQTFSLLKTSEIAGNNGALAAINGGFFDMDNGGSVSYLEKNDSVISRSMAPDQKWGVSDSIINGALLMDEDKNLLIEPARSEQVYEDSEKESFVLLTGPLLIKDAVPQHLPHMSFSNLRHPRTCLGITEKSILLITVDGRSEQAAGMSLKELQDMLLDMGCLDAINLDGGGSTSMWIKDRGVVNNPSDPTGERPVANALLILRK